MRSVCQSLWLLAGLLVSLSCHRRADLSPYTHANPWHLVEEIDRQVYSPVNQGLTRLEADLLVDATGFYPPAQRSKNPVWVPVKFTWDRGQATFAVRNLPPGSEPLEKVLLANLQGKEEDIVNRPFRDRLAGDRLTVTANDDGTLRINAMSPVGRHRWNLDVDETFRVVRIHVQLPGGGEVQSHLRYENRSPARISQIESEYVEGGQTVNVIVSIEYQQAGPYEIPHEIRYRGQAGAKPLPPLTLRVKQVRVFPAVLHH